MILKEEKYTYNDLSIMPSKISDISSRSECIIPDQLPLFTAPMDSVVGEKNLDEWAKNGITAIIPRTIDLGFRLSKGREGYWIAVSLQEFKDHFVDSDVSCPYKVLIDVANGHMKILYDLVKEAKTRNRGLIIMVGNIANPSTYYQAEEARVDYIRCGIGAGRGCFARGTKVTMANGERKSIETIRPGEKVLTHTGSYKTVSDVVCLIPEPGSMVLITSEFGEVLATSNHKFLVGEDWIEAKDLERATLETGFMVPVKVQEHEDVLEVYDLTVEDDHSYFAEGYAVHNCITSSNTAVHFPMASLINETYEIKKRIGGCAKIVADGGIRNYSDIIKALALGADCVMVGSVFTKMLESSAKTYFSYVTSEERWYEFKYDPQRHKYEDGRFYDLNVETGTQDEIKLKKEFYGMASKKGQIAMNGKKTRTAEGLSTTLPVEYTMESWTNNFRDYLKSAMSYTGCRDLREFIGEQIMVILSPGTKESVNK